jgi:hypothetical protein
MLKSNRNNFIVVNLVLKEKCYDSKADQGPMCPKDGYVLFQDSELLSGMLGKTLLGGGNKNGLFYRLINDNSPVKKKKKNYFNINNKINNNFKLKIIYLQFFKEPCCLYYD